MSLVEIDELTKEQVASICDHTFLQRSESYREAGKNAVQLRKKAFEEFLGKAKQLSPYAVCVRPEDIPYAVESLPDTIKVASVVGFPDGAHYRTMLKLTETEHALYCGAKEIDMVLNYERFKSNSPRYSRCARLEIEAVTKKAHENDALVKLILETSELEAYELIKACKLAERLGVDFVKTSTGFTSAGANEDALRIMREYFSRGIKLSGGVNKENYKLLLSAASGRDDEYLDLDPMKIRIGESSLLEKL